MKFIALPLGICLLMLFLNLSVCAAAPNGYDYFVRASEAFVPDEKGVDSATDYRNFDSEKTYPRAAKEAWLQQNKTALQLLREGLKYPASLSRTKFTAIELPYARFRNLARALVVESHVYAERGEFDEAANSALDIVHFSYEMARGGPLITRLVGNAIQLIGTRELENLLPQLTAKQASDAAMHLEQLYRGRFPYYKTLQAEKAFSIKTLQEGFEQENWREMLIVGNDPPTAQIAQTIQLSTMSERATIEEFSRLWDAQIENEHLPYSKMQPPTPPISPLSGLVLSTTEIRWGQGRADTASVFAMTMLALRAYQLNQGNYPRDLQELVPRYLSKVPVDPFDGLAALHYRRDGEKYFLWSIGPDGINNNGRSIENANRTGRGRYRTWDISGKGDLVAGMNLP